MAHFAQINEFNRVVNVMKIDDPRFDEEVTARPFIKDVLGLPGTWLKTSYNTNSGQHTLGGTPFRGNYAVIGGIYDEVRDVFTTKSPYPSWILNENTFQWEPPIPMPGSEIPHEERVTEMTTTPTDIPGQFMTRIKAHKWNEDILNWEETYTIRIGFPPEELLD